MNNFFLFVLALFTFHCAAFSAEFGSYKSTERTSFKLDGSNIVVYFDHPEGWTQVKNTSLDMLFFSPQEAERLFGFYFFENSTFCLTNVNDFMVFVDWLTKSVFEDLPRTKVSIETSKTFGKCSFILTKKDGEKIYNFVYIAPINENMFFGIINTSKISKEEAFDDAKQLIGNISWTK